MPCENYREALTDAAAGETSNSAARGTRPDLECGLTRELEAHLAACADCRAFFAEEIALFAAIDSGVSTRTNHEMPAALLPRVRAAVAEQRRSAAWWAPAGI